MSHDSLTTESPEVEPGGTAAPLLSKSTPISRPREPWFLTGQTSVLQRAIRMTGFLAIGSWLAAWGVALASLLCEFWFGNDHISNLMIVLGSILMTPLVYGPLQYWNRRGVLAIVATTCGWAAVLYGFFRFIELFLWLQVTTTYQPSIIYAFVIGYPASAALTGLWVLRRTKWHAIAYLSAILLALAASLSVQSFEDAQGKISYWTGYQSAILLVRAGALSLWFAAMSVPWGLPFWWPPQITRSLEAKL